MSEHRTFKTVSLALTIVLGLVAQSNTTPVQNPGTLTVAGGCSWCAGADSENATGVILAHFGPKPNVKAHPIVGDACGRGARVKGMRESDAPLVSG